MKISTIAILLAAVGFGMLASGCAAALKANNEGFPSAAPGFLVTDMRAGQMVKDRVLPPKYKVLGSVYAEAKTVNYLGLVALGDASYKTLKRTALEKYPGATDIINLEVDFYHKNVLCLINEVTTIIRGEAIQY